MCFISGAVLDEQNVITCCMYSSDYDFLFSCCLSPSLSLFVFATAHCFTKSFCECLFPPQAALFLFLNQAAMVICQLQVEKQTLIWVCFTWNSHSVQLYVRPSSSNRALAIVSEMKRGKRSTCCEWLVGAEAVRSCVALTCFSLWPQWSRQRLLE